MHKLTELKIVLNGIREARRIWKQALHAKLVEILETEPGIEPKVAYSRAITHPAVAEKFAPVMSLYGAVGEDLDSYIESIPEETVESLLKAVS